MNKTLVKLAKEKLERDADRYSGKFPSDYEAEFAKYMFYAAYAQSNGDPKAAVELLSKTMGWHDSGEVGPFYSKLIGYHSDGANSWDKVRHFIGMAAVYLSWHRTRIPHLAANIAGWGKEIYDELEHLFGKDLEGFSPEDIHSDNLGEKFAQFLAEGLNWGHLHFLGGLLKFFQNSVAVEGSLVLCAEHGMTTIQGASGDDVEMIPVPVARLHDPIACGAEIVSASAGLLIGEQPAARVGDMISHGGLILTGVSSLLIN